VRHKCRAAAVPGALASACPSACLPSELSSSVRARVAFDIASLCNVRIAPADRARHVLRGDLGSAESQRGCGCRPAARPYADNFADSTAL